MATKNLFVKDPNQPAEFKTQKDFDDFVKCCDPVNGYMYFLENFYYIQHPTKGSMLFKPFAYQKNLVNIYHNYKRSAALCHRQSGKALFWCTIILTTNGFKQVGDLRVGDQIYGPDGNPTNITFITETMHDHTCYELEFCNGEKIIADAEHQWTWIDADGIEVTGNTEELLKVCNQVYIPHTSEINFKSRSTTKSPYDTGKELLTYECIPDEFLINDADVRKQFLLGVMDGIGSVNESNECVLTIESDIIRKQLQYIISSLGIKSRIDNESLVFGFNTYALFTNKELIDKQLAYISSESDSRIYINSITTTKSVPVKCLQVDNESHLFLAGHTLIPTHNTTTAAGYLLWYAMFVPDSTVLVAAHKFAGAQEIMQRVRYAYESCPNHIKAGVVTYNKQSIDFDNGSRIVAQTTTENTGRGMSISLLYCLDGTTSFVTIRDKTTMVEETISLTDLYTLLCMGIIRQDRCRGNVMFTENSNYEILTPYGWKDFKGITKTADKITYNIRLSNGNCVNATGSHFFYINGKKVTLKQLRVGDSIDLIGDNSEIIAISENDKSDVYDIIEVDHPSHQYIVNDNIITKNCDEFAFLRPSIENSFLASIAPTLATGGKAIFTSTPNGDQNAFARLWFGANKTIDEYGNDTDVGINGYKAFQARWQDHPERDQAWADKMRAELGDVKYRIEIECEMVSDEETLIDPLFLPLLEEHSPLETIDKIRWYKKPKKGNLYTVSLDPSLGTGGDPAAIEIFEANTTTQVGEWTHNKTGIQEQIKIMAKICNYLSDITDIESVYYSVENNSIGEAALVALNNFGEQNIRATFLSERGKKRKGFTTSNKSKLTACSKFKHLIETRKMTVYSRGLISEMKNFIANSGSYAAKAGTTDDLVMATLLNISMMNMLSDFSFEMNKHMRDTEDTVEPMPFFMSMSSRVY